MAASDLSDSDDTDDSLVQTKIIKSAYESETFDADGTIHVEGMVGSASISPSGRDVVLASPEGLAVIDLDSPYSAPRRVKSHGMPWLVVDIQWSPFAARDYWVASTANHCCLVWNLNRPDDSSAGAVEHSLRGHRRSITDINFSAHHPDMLATCSVDGYVHCWDLRRPNTPALTFIDWSAGATQVKYNRQDEHIIASSHNRCVHIWDDRKASLPLRTIEAHTSKIYGLDWNRTQSNCLVTCSLDKTIKFWDYSVRGSGGVAVGNSGGSTTFFTGGCGFGSLGLASSAVDLSASGSIGGSSNLSSGAINEDDVPERTIHTHFPVWRARHTPFNGGLLAMPQNAPGNLYLYDARPTSVLAAEDPASASEPVAIFSGHGHHKVKEFLWRTRAGVEDGFDNREFQLVSWGEDNKLRLRRLDGPDLATVGFERGRPAPKALNITRTGATYKTFRILEDIGDYEKRNATMSSLVPTSRKKPRPTVQDDGNNSPYSSGEHHHHHHHHRTRHQHSLSQQQLATPSPAPFLSVKSPPQTPHRGGKSDRRITWKNPSMRATRSNAKEPNRSNVQLDWMKGVTMSKRKSSTDPNMQNQEPLQQSTDFLDPDDPQHLRKVSSERMTDSAISSPMKLSTNDTSSAGDWSGPETIQEEIVRITGKLRGIKWEEVDMDSLSLTASMKGPWGVDNQTVFIKVRVLIPSNYPAARSPRFYVENSSLVPDPSHRRIDADLHLIASEFLKRRRNCLLATFRYLLGEHSLSKSLGLLDRPTASIAQFINDGDDGDDDDSSTTDDDDDDDENGNNSGEDEAGIFSPTSINLTKGMILAGADASHALSALPPPPPPRSCGAQFTRDGRLVSFFLTKTGKASAKIMFEPQPPPTSEEMAELQAPVFIGFGRVLPGRPGRKGTREWYQGSSSSGDESDSSTYSSSSGSSSATGSSGSSHSSLRPSEDVYHYSVRNMMDPWTMGMGFQRRIVKIRSDKRRRALAAASAGSSDGDDVGSEALNQSGTLDPDLPAGPKSSVEIVDMRSFLPSKRDLAREYVIFGDGAEVCEHNAAVAEKYDEEDLAHIWRYAALLLKSDVPLKLAPAHYSGGRRQKSVLVIARDAVARDRSNKNGRQRRPGDQLSGRVKWGLHPLARDFVDDLFDYFERLADIQMLAMLSCIFGESAEEDSVAYAESHLSKSDTPLPMKAPSFSLDYLPSTRGLSTAGPSPLGAASGSNSSAATAATAVFYDGSIDPDEDYDDLGYDEEGNMWDTAGDNSFSGGETPPKWYSTLGRGQGGNVAVNGAPLSSSPLFGIAASRFFRRGNTAVISAIAASIPQTLTTMLSSSPQQEAASAVLSRRASFFDSQTSQRQSPQSRQALPQAAVVPLSHAYKQLLLHSTSAQRDIPYNPSAFHRLLPSASTSPKTVGAGKLSSSESPQDHGPRRKRPSPAETIFGNLTSGNLTWAASALFGGGGAGAGGAGAGAGAGAGVADRGGVGAGGAGIGMAVSGGQVVDPGSAAASTSDEGQKREALVAAAAASAAAKGARAQAEAAAATLVAVNVNVRTFNDHLFDDDGWMLTSLLGGPRRRRMYAEYRYAYSELLQVWGEPLARLEVLKFNVLREDAMKTSNGHARGVGSTSTIVGDDGDDACTVDGRVGGDGGGSGAATPGSSKANKSKTVPLSGAGKRGQLVAVRDSGRGLDAIGVCQLCEMQLEPLEYDSRGAVGGKVGGAVGICRRCHRTQSQLRCVYCTEPIDAVFIPCFGCGCASHPQCIRAWFGAGERYCPAGDECPCPEDATSGRVESWTAMQAELMSLMRPEPGAAGSHEDDGNYHQDYYTLSSQQLLKQQLQQHNDQLQQQQEHHRFKAKGLIAQARRSAHYASSSSSAFLMPSFGQPYRADGGGRGIKDAGEPSTIGGRGVGRGAAVATASNGPTTSSYNYDGTSRGNLTPAGRAVSSALNAGSGGGGGGGTNSGAGGGGGFWSAGRRSRQPSSGLRQQLQQHQYEQNQQQQQRPQSSQMQAIGQPPPSRFQGRSQSEGQGSAGSAVPSAAASGGAPSAGGPLSAARLSLSSRLLRNSALRRQASSQGGNPGGNDSNHNNGDAASPPNN